MSTCSDATATACCCWMIDGLMEDSRDTHVVYLGLGSNMGDRRSLLLRACEEIAERVGLVERCSSFIETEPWGFQSTHRFLNACVGVETTLTPRQLLHATQQIELQLGRRQKSANGIYHDRPIDIDILLYDDLHIDEPDLKIPHPLMHQRDFVMISLHEILKEKVDVDVNQN